MGEKNSNKIHSNVDDHILLQLDTVHSTYHQGPSDVFHILLSLLYMRAFARQFNLRRLEPNQTARHSLRSSASIFVIKAVTPMEFTTFYSGLTIKYVLHYT